MKHLRLSIKYLFLFIMLLSICNLNAKVNVNWLAEEKKARRLYQEGKIDEAIILFREIILSSDHDKVKREAYYYLALTYMNAGKYDLAEKNLEYYLTHFSDERENYINAEYQKGRLLFLQEQYQFSIEQLDIFIKKYPEHKLVANAYYWIGEALFALGHFDDAALFFHIVINKYPTSFKREASSYKLRLIEHKKSELALQNLLKWSQEQFIATLNKLRIKEKTLNEALHQYEIKSTGLTGQSNLEQLENEKLILLAKISDLENQVQLLKAADPDNPISDQMAQLQLKEQLLNQKEETLRLLEKKLREKEQSLE